MTKPNTSNFLMSILVPGLIVLSLTFSGCNGKAENPGPGAAGQPAQGASAQPSQGGGSRAPANRGAVIMVQSVVVAEGPLIVVHETAGTVQPVTQSKVAAQVGGVVAQVHYKAGAWVNAGTTVVQLDTAQLKLAGKSAQAAYENAKINLSTGEDTTSQANPKLALQVQSSEAALSAARKNYDAAAALFKLGGATASQVDSAQSSLQQAQANLEAAKTALDQNKKADIQNLAQLRLAVNQAENQLQQAQLNLQYASIKAPFDGQISAVNVNPGEYVGTNTAAFTLVSAEKEVAFSVAPSDASLLTNGKPIDFGGEGKAYKITVKQLPTAPSGGVVPMTAAVPASFPPSFGAVGTVSYQLTLAQGILVPLSALQTSENKNFVFVLEAGKALSRNITIIAESGITAAVSGIKAGSPVIVNPPPGLLSGSAVQPVGQK